MVSAVPRAHEAICLQCSVALTAPGHRMTWDDQRCAWLCVVEASQEIAGVLPSGWRTGTSRGLEEPCYTLHHCLGTDTRGAGLGAKGDINA